MNIKTYQAIKQDLKDYHFDNHTIHISYDELIALIEYQLPESDENQIMNCFDQLQNDNFIIADYSLDIFILNIKGKNKMKERSYMKNLNYQVEFNNRLSCQFVYLIDALSYIKNSSIRKSMLKNYSCYALNDNGKPIKSYNYNSSDHYFNR